MHDFRSLLHLGWVYSSLSLIGVMKKFASVVVERYDTSSWIQAALLDYNPNKSFYIFCLDAENEKKMRTS